VLYDRELGTRQRSASSGKGVTSMLIGDDPASLIEELMGIFPGATLRAIDYDRLLDRIIGMIENPSVSVELPLDFRGTPFQQKVWAALRAIPAGVTTTYAALAGRVGEPKAVRAVASACAANKLALGRADRRLAVRLSLGRATQACADRARSGAGADDGMRGRAGYPPLKPSCGVRSRCGRSRACD
jgi:O6-methylguanine-DNA--protein-cysteine methyltransferase